MASELLKRMTQFQLAQLRQARLQEACADEVFTFKLEGDEHEEVLDLENDVFACALQLLAPAASPVSRCAGLQHEYNVNYFLSR